MEIQALNLAPQYLDFDSIRELGLVNNRVRLDVHSEHVVAYEFICKRVNVEAKWISLLIIWLIFVD